MALRGEPAWDVGGTSGRPAGLEQVKKRVVGGDAEVSLQAGTRMVAFHLWGMESHGAFEQVRDMVHEHSASVQNRPKAAGVEGASVRGPPQ